MCRSGVFRTQTVAAANDERGIFLSVEAVLDVHVERFAIGTRFLGTVEYGNALGCLGHSCQEVLGRERTVEVNSYQTDLFALGAQVVDHFADGFCYRAHSDDDAFCFGVAVVVEQTVVAAGDFADLLHVVFYDFRNGVIEAVAGFAVLEEVVRVFGHTTCNRSHGVHGAAAEFGQSFLVDQRSEVFVVQLLNLLDFVRGAEAVEEVDERHACLQGSQVGNTGEVHHFLYRAFGQHGEACLAAGHYILMVAEDTQGVAGQCTCGYVEYAGQVFTGNLVHVGDHQQQTLRSSVGGSQRTCLQRAVYGTGGTGFRLHFLNQYCFAEDVLATCGSPFVHVFSHRRRRGDGVDGCHLGEHVRDVGSGFVTITSDEFFLFSHN